MTQSTDSQCQRGSTGVVTPVTDVTTTLVATWDEGIQDFKWVAATAFGNKKGKGSSKGQMTFDPGPDSFLWTIDLEEEKRGLKFLPLADALRVGPPGHCPPKKAGNADGQINAIKRKKDQLTVQNFNVTAEDWTYSLYFVDKDGKPFHYDPAIANGGGGTGLQEKQKDHDRDDDHKR